MTTIGQYVKLDTDAEFRSDVQLSAYNTAYNLPLLKSYLFTATTPAGNWYSSLSILDMVIDTFNNSRLENRMVTIADYGHGKSHLALALANYFGRPYPSEEVNVLLSKIEQTLKDKASYTKFLSFKKNGSPHMVLCLRGDVAGNMRSQFIRELERVIEATPEIRGTRMPFWFSQAEDLLKKLEGSALEKANAYLSQFNTDVAELIDEVHARNMQMYERCIEAIRAAYGFAPDLGSEVSLKQILAWAVEKFCGAGRPFRGILILFDEFTLYLYNYAARGLFNELQDLMNGVSEHPTKVIFLAFAQRDPSEYVKLIMDKGDNLNSVLKELDRIPRKLLLYSLMESVIDSYLVQDKKLWDILLNDPDLKGWFSSACDITFDAFASRYRTTLRWSYEDFQTIVAKGCFPLHPMTTALLCNVKIQAIAGTQSPRTILGFVFDQLNQRKDQPLSVNGRINWIMPVELVDFFNEQLAGERFRLYDNARRMIGPDASDEEKRVLKALLLVDIAELKGGYNEQVDHIATMAGLPSGTAKGILKKLVEQRVIRQDATNRRFSFFAGNLDISDYDRLVQEKLQTIQISAEDIRKLGDKFVPDVPPTIAWGKAEDWQAKSILLLAEDFTVENLSKEIVGYRTNQTTISPGQRGLIFWTLAKTEIERSNLIATAQGILDKATEGKFALPILVVLPRDASPNLISALRRQKALNAFTFSEREKYKEMHAQDAASVEVDIVRELSALSYHKDNYTVMRPKSAYMTTTRLSTALVGIGQAVISSVVTRIYDAAYKYHPPVFYTQYGENGINLKNATKLLAAALLENSVGSHVSVLENNSLVKQMIDSFLVSKWGLLNPATRRIQPPSNAHIQAAWNLLDQTFAPHNGETSVQEVLLALFNPPYGYDFNTLTLLFSAWFGHNARDLKISIGPAKKTLEDVRKLLEAGPKEFITKICVTDKLFLARQDLSELEKKALDAITRVDTGGLTIQQAEALLPELHKYKDDDRFDPARRNNAQSAYQLLEEAVEKAKQHQEEAEKIRKEIAKARSLDTLFNLQNRIKELPACTIVLPNGAGRTELSAALKDRLEKLVEEACLEAQKLDDLYNYGLQKSQLEALGKQLRAEHFNALAERTVLALQELERQLARLEKSREEKMLRQTIEAMDTRSTSLHLLYEYRQKLEKMEELPPVVEVVKENKLKYINERIAEIESAAKKLLAEFNEVRSLSQLDQWHHRFQLYKERVVQTPLEEEFQAVSASFEDLKRAWDELMILDNQPIHKPEDVESIARQIDELEKSFQQSQTVGVKLLFQTSRELLQKRHTDLIHKAVQLYESIENDFHAGRQSLMHLLDRLEKPPIFLPEDCARKWAELRTAIKTKMDQDLVGDIVQRFERINDVKTQAELVKKLITILKAKGV